MQDMYPRRDPVVGPPQSRQPPAPARARAQPSANPAAPPRRTNAAARAAPAAAAATTATARTEAAPAAAATATETAPATPDAALQKRQPPEQNTISAAAAEATQGAQIAPHHAPEAETEMGKGTELETPWPQKRNLQSQKPNREIRSRRQKSSRVLCRSPRTHLAQRRKLLPPDDAH